MKTWLGVRHNGFFIKSEAKAKGPGRNYWLGFKEHSGDVHEHRITNEQYLALKKQRKEEK